MIQWLAKRATPIAALALGLGLSACDVSVNWNEVEGVPLAELDTSGDPPTTIELGGPDRVEITEGDSLEITLDGSAEAGEALRFDRDGSRLVIGRDRDVYDGNETAIVRIMMPAPTGLSIAGSGTIRSASMSDNAEIEIAGSGDITVDTLAAKSLEVEIAGSGRASAAGTATKLSIEIAGAGDVDLAQLNADDVTVEIAGSGDVRLASNGTVNAEIAGSGDIVVTGSATCSVNSAGSGSLTCRPAPTAEEAPAEPQADAE